MGSGFLYYGKELGYLLSVAFKLEHAASEHRSDTSRSAAHALFHTTQSGILPVGVLILIYDRQESFGGYLEDFKPGDIFKHWPGKTITEADNHLFSLLTMNTNPLHIDDNYMQEHQHGKILVVGPLILSLTVGMSVRDTSGKAIANLEYERVTHDAPVFQGDTIYAESEILDVRESRSRSNRGVVYMESRAFNHRREKVLTLRRRFLVPKREA